MKTEIEWLLPIPENLSDDVEILICHGERGHIKVGYYSNGNFYGENDVDELYEVKYVAWLPKTPLSRTDCNDGHDWFHIPLSDYKECRRCGQQR